jgi:hypothetical protein
MGEIFQVRIRRQTLQSIDIRQNATVASSRGPWQARAENYDSVLMIIDKLTVDNQERTCFKPWKNELRI